MSGDSRSSRSNSVVQVTGLRFDRNYVPIGGGVLNVKADGVAEISTMIVIDPLGITINGDLEVVGTAQIDEDLIVLGTLDVSGDTTLGDLSVDGTLDVSGAATITGTLDVSGATTLAAVFIQNPDGSYPADGSVPAITGLSGEVAWTPVTIDGASNLSVPLANFQVTGDGNLTGSAQAEYITLPDLNILNRHETYLWAQGDDILWQNGGTQPNISLTAWMGLLAPNTASPVVRPSGPTDTINMQNATYALITTLLDRGILLTEAASPPTLRFNSSTNIRFTTFLTADPTDVAERKTVTYPVAISSPVMNTLCSSVTSALSGAGVEAALVYDTVQQLVRILVNSGYSLTINDVGAYGESTRFMNHLGIGESQILPSYETDVPNYSFTITGPSFLALTPNNDAPLAAPVLVAGALTSFTYTFTITAPSTAGLTGDNLLQYYGIFLGGIKNNIIDATNGSWTITGLSPSSTYTVAVSAIDKYNESPQASLTFTTPAVVIPWPPAGYTLGIRRNGVGGAPPVNDILVTPIRTSPALNNTYSFSIIPNTTLSGICLRISVDDGCVIRFTGTQPGGSPPNPFVNIPGPQPGATFGGIYQFSQPINLTANTVYDVSITYYNNQSTSAEFYLAYVQPTVDIPWSSNPNYACPPLNALLGQNLFAICCYGP